LLETAFPYRELSLIAQRDRRVVDPVLAAHRWWARRPPAVFRGILLAAAFPAGTSMQSYWERYSSDEKALEGLRVYDAFVGGGTTLVEAARLGALPYGTDIDPVAVAIAHHALSRPKAGELAEAGESLVAFLREHIADLFRDAENAHQPLHYFYLRIVRCPNCGEAAPLYRDLILARGPAKDGAVRRESAIDAFCPDCFELHHYSSPTRKELRCCYRRDLFQGTFKRGKFECPSCGERSDHKALRTGVAPLHLLAVEEASSRDIRRLRPTSASDLALLENASAYLAMHESQLSLPATPFSLTRADPRPISFGITSPRQLFSDRQLALFGHAFRWIEEASVTPEVKRGLRLAVSQALTTNNLLCGYARDYGRLAPLFSIRSYALPILSVELNPFHPTAGRGTLKAMLRRLAGSVADDVTRHTWSPATGSLEHRLFKFNSRIANPSVLCASAATASFDGTRFDVALFDPPYFDYIAYSELSEFYRAWWPDATLGGAPLLPTRPESVDSFAEGFASCLRNTLAQVASGAVLVFTFHSTSPQAWQSVGKALDAAGLCVTAMWPVLTDPHMGHHSFEGNCEWDIILVTRAEKDCDRAVALRAQPDWDTALAPLGLSDVDRASLALAEAMVAERFATYRTRVTN